MMFARRSYKHSISLIICLGVRSSIIEVAEHDKKGHS